MISIVKEYNNYIERIPELIAESNFKSGYFVDLLGLTAPTYYRKLRTNSFTKQEITKLTTVLFPREAYLEELKADLRQAEDDIKNGRVTAHDTVMENLKKNYNQYGF